MGNFNYFIHIKADNLLYDCTILSNQIFKFTVKPCWMRGRCVKVISNLAISLSRGSIISNQTHVFECIHVI